MLQYPPGGERFRLIRILVVTINRAEARNAFDSISAQAMHAAMDLLDAEDELFVGVITEEAKYAMASRSH